ncbi:hypothetical protein [Methylocella silvestris]|uniref:PAS fold-2 domain-containing protein n=1 Tax=Methylocella silvestris TaxID=199596 RepID=A0A2J7TFS8_METSI|nr:hypothetical protein [Methylocella silvestris]PNG25612.1 hypothetical protein CR492_12880 [Methylocella silvestris]
MSYALDLKECEREPIATPSSIQPYGALLVLDQKGKLIVQAAGDTERLLGIKNSVLGKSVADVLGISVADLLTQADDTLLGKPAYLCDLG